ncbi:hypothetical protein SDJN02_25755, partial [Cucurbita argyrosperma subsp. argyrosperma]
NPMKLDFLVKILFEIILGLKPFAFTEIIRWRQFAGFMTRISANR